MTKILLGTMLALLLAALVAGNNKSAKIACRECGNGPPTQWNWLCCPPGWECDVTCDKWVDDGRGNMSCP